MQFFVMPFLSFNADILCKLIWAGSKAFLVVVALPNGTRMRCLFWDKTCASCRQSCCNVVSSAVKDAKVCQQQAAAVAPGIGQKQRHHHHPCLVLCLLRS